MCVRTAESQAGLLIPPPSPVASTFHLLAQAHPRYECDWKKTHLERLSSPESLRAAHRVLGLTDTKPSVKCFAARRRDLFH